MADSKLSDLTALGSAPTSLLIVYAVASGADYKMTGDEMQSWRVSSVQADASAASQSMLTTSLDSATDRTLTITGTPVAGHSITAIALQVSGVTGHKILLPSGVTWDGTNRAALFDAVGDSLFAIALSATRYGVISNNGVTFAAT